MGKRKIISKTERLKAERDKTLRVLLRTGYVAQVKSNGRNYRPPFPDLSTDDHAVRYPSIGGFAKTTAKRELPKDAKLFPVGHLHKQGLQLISPGSAKEDLSAFSGKKT